MPSIDYNYHPDIPREITNALIEHISAYEGRSNNTYTMELIKQSIREYQRELLLSIGYKLDLGVHFSPDGVTLVPLPHDIHIMPRLIVSDESWIKVPQPAPRLAPIFSDFGTNSFGPR